MSGTAAAVVLKAGRPRAVWHGGGGTPRLLPRELHEAAKAVQAELKRIAPLPTVQAKMADGIVTLKNGKPVRYRLQGEEYLTVALIDFSDYQHGQIPEPDRTWILLWLNGEEGSDALVSSWYEPAGGSVPSRCSGCSSAASLPPTLTSSPGTTTTTLTLG